MSPWSNPTAIRKATPTLRRRNLKTEAFYGNVLVTLICTTEAEAVKSIVCLRPNGSDSRSISRFL